MILVEKEATISFYNASNRCRVTYIQQKKIVSRTRNEQQENQEKIEKN